MNDTSRPREHGARRSDGNLRTRVLSAVVLAVVVLSLAYLGGIAFRLLIACIAGAIFYEWRVMTGKGGGKIGSVIAWLALAVILVLIILGTGALVQFTVLAVAVLAVAVISLSVQRDGGTAPGLAYAALPCIAIALLRDSDFAGVLAIFFLFVVVWATDIAAFFVGRALGGPKLAPSISPGKTWSGAIGGAAGGIVAGVVFGAYAGASLGLAYVAVVALGLSVVAQIGDLFESAIKRRSGVKDSGWLIPGHGGVMDRVDGLVAAGFVFYLIGAFLAGAETPAHGFFA